MAQPGKSTGHHYIREVGLNIESTSWGPYAAVNRDVPMSYVLECALVLIKSVFGKLFRVTRYLI